jgi:hypothetical protein
MDGTVIGVGSFTQPATAVNQIIAIPSNCDSLDIYNYTQASLTGGNGYHFRWQRGFPVPTVGIYEAVGGGSAVTAGVTVAGAFTLYDPSANPVGALNNGSTGVTAVSTATPPVVTVGSTAGMAPGSVVRMIDVTSAQQLGGIDFTVGYGTFNATHFSLDYMSTLATAGTTGSFYPILFNPLFYPVRRTITNITQAANAVITLSVTHGYQVGQEVRINCPAACGMTQIDGMQGAIIAIDTATGNGHNTITVNINTTGFSAFTFPITTAVPFTPAEVVPIGEDTATALNLNQNILSDATVNTGYYGMILAAGALLPAGVAGDVIFWQSNKAQFGGL